MKNKISIDKRVLFLIIFGAIYLAAVITFSAASIDKRIEAIVFTVLLLIVGARTAINAFKDFISEPFNEGVLMVIAAVGAMLLGEFAEAVAVMFFFAVGEEFEEHAERRSEQAIEKLYSMLGETAVIIKDGKKKEIAVENVSVGDVLFVKAGERVVCDGVLDSDEGYFDTSMISGESVPKRIKRGGAVLSGYLCVSAPVLVKAEKTAERSSAASIIELIKEAETKKAKSEKFIRKFASIYTPAVIIAAALVAIVPPILGGDPVFFVRCALNFLVISCPCALVISVPIAFFSGVGKAFENGIIVKGSAAIETADMAKYYVFDKTGTLTKGDFTVKKVFPEDKKDLILKVAKSLEEHSSHPIARAIVNAYDGELFDARAVKEIAANGLIGILSGKKACVGTAGFLKENGFKPVSAEGCDTVVYVGFDGVLGYISVGDRLKDGAKELVSDLSRLRITPVMLTGDTEISAENVAKELGIENFKAELKPKDKVESVEKLKNGGKTLFVGDGINDAPVIASADVSVAMGSGSDIAADTADIVICDDDVKKVLKLKKIARSTMRVVRLNIAGSIAVKAAVFLLSLFGLAPLYLAVIADVGVMVAATLNSFALSAKKGFDK